MHINRAGVLNLIHERAYGTEGTYTSEETDTIIKAVQLKKVNHGAPVIRGEIITSGANPQMKETIRRSFAYNRQPLSGEYRSLKELCEAQNFDLRHTRRILNLRFLAGDILQKILTDRVPQHWTMGAWPKWRKENILKKALLQVVLRNYLHPRRKIEWV